MALPGPNDTNTSEVWNASVNATKAEVSATAGLIYSISLLNATAAEAYLQVFDAAAADVTVGNTTPTFVLGVDTIQQGHYQFPKPIAMLNGITVASTTARAGSTNAVQEVTITYNN